MAVQNTLHSLEKAGIDDSRRKALQPYPLLLWLGSNPTLLTLPIIPTIDHFVPVPAPPLGTGVSFISQNVPDGTGVPPTTGLGTDTTLIQPPADFITRNPRYCPIIHLAYDEGFGLVDRPGVRDTVIVVAKYAAPAPVGHAVQLGSLDFAFHSALRDLLPLLKTEKALEILEGFVKHRLHIGPVREVQRDTPFLTVANEFNNVPRVTTQTVRVIYENMLDHTVSNQAADLNKTRTVRVSCRPHLSDDMIGRYRHPQGRRQGEVPLKLGVQGGSFLLARGTHTAVGHAGPRGFRGYRPVVNH